MENIEIMQLFQSNRYLNERPPNFVFGEGTFFLLMPDYFLIEITIVQVLHDNTA